MADVVIHVISSLASSLTNPNVMKDWRESDMALLRKLFYRKPPDGLLEISDKVYVFDSCFTTDAWEEDEYKVHLGGVVGQLQEHFPEASILVFNFREGSKQSVFTDALSKYDITIMDYPRHYEGCPLLTMEQAPRELLHLLSALNPIPSQLRYLQYVSRRNVASAWPPLDRALTVDCVILRHIPNSDGEGGCRPIFRIYGQDPFLVSDKTPKVRYSTQKKSKNVRTYKQAECELVKIDINCHIQGDVVLECMSLHDDMQRESMMFRLVFNTAFIRSNILMLNRDEVEMLWDAKDQFPKDFRVEILFSEMDAAGCVVAEDSSCFDQQGELSDDAFAAIHELFGPDDWLLDQMAAADVKLNPLQQKRLMELSPRRLQERRRQSLTEENYASLSPRFGNLHSPMQSPDNGISNKEPSFPQPLTPPLLAPVPPSRTSNEVKKFPSTPPVRPPLPLSTLSYEQSDEKQPDSSIVKESKTSVPDRETSQSQHLPTPVLNEKSIDKAEPPSPPPPPSTPPLKEKSIIGAGPPPPPPPPPPPIAAAKEKSKPGPGPGPAPPPPLPPPPSPPIAAGKEKSVIGHVPPPPPPPPIVAGKEKSTAGPPPPPPPPLGSGQSVSTSAIPPPPPAPTSSSNSSGPPPPPPMIGKGGSASSIPPPPPGGKTPSPAPPMMKGRLSRTISAKSQQTKKLKPLHWLKLTRAVQGSLWAETQKSGDFSKAPEIDMSELETLFSAAVSVSDHGSKSGARGSRGLKSDRVQLVDHRRAYNCEIMLSKVKVPLQDLMSSVLDLEDSALDVDQVDNLIKFCPTKEEMELLKNYNGDKDKLGKCEQFFLELMKVPRVEAKLRVFSFKIQFQTQVSDLKRSLNVVNSAAEEIKNSNKLKRVMQTILSLGNALNQGTARGSAIGFRLDSLLKLTETRARNNKMTLMHYLCKVLAEKLPELLDFSKGLANLEAASKVQLKALAEEMQAINKGLEKVMQELSAAENDGPVSENFSRILKEFLCYAEAEVRTLASLYSAVGRNVDALILYFGEDPARCPFEQVVSTLLNFVRMFNRALEENCKQAELEMKKSAEAEKSKLNNVHKESEQLLHA
ncbi:hypothetical protein ACFE04_003506 [Oxalis oulophora]